MPFMVCEAFFISEEEILDIERQQTEIFDNLGCLDCFTNILKA
jgi:hypothetical protein